LHRIKITPDIELAVEDSGNGKQAILFIHGLGNHKGVWHYNTAYLQKEYRCIAIDLPGNGNSSHGDYPYSIFFYAETVKKLIDALQLESVVIVGHSMGGQVAIVFALRYPELTKKLILLASSGLEYFSEFDSLMITKSLQMGQLMNSNEFYLESAIKQSFYHFEKEKINQTVEDAKAFIGVHQSKNWKKMIDQSIQGMLKEQVQPFLGQITAQTLIVFGEYDAMIPNKLLHPSETVHSIAKRASAKIKNSQVLIIKEAGHFIQIEKSVEINELIVNFIKQ
jgi:pimeloyl-ACP methyl ester carboxylesterase